MRFKKNINIGASIITIDSADCIIKAIESVIPVCSQICIVDTGSSDNTPTLISKAGCEIHFLKWNNDFAESRNYALDLMRTDWIISIDSDEVLNTESFLENIYLFENTNTGGLRTTLLNHLENNTTKSHKYPRIYRNSKKIRYSGKIHEQINESIIEAGFEIADSGIIIDHFGYKSNTEARAKRNNEMLNDLLKDNPDDDWVKYHKAETLFSEKNYVDSMKLYSDIISSHLLTDQQKQVCRIRLAQLSLQNDDYLKADEWTDFFATENELEGLRLWIKSISKLKLNDLKKSKELLLKINDTNNQLVEKNNFLQFKELLEKL